MKTPDLAFAPLSRRSLRQATSRRLWIILAALIACHHLWVFFSTQNTLTLLVVLIVAWGGAFICIEDLLPTLQPRPSRSGMIVGTVLLVWSLLRAQMILANDYIIYALPFVEGLGLALLCFPPSRLRPFAASLAILAMPALLVHKYYPEVALSHLTALLTGVGLQALGIPADVYGRLVSLPQGGVSVAESCSGRDLLVMVLIVATVFLLAFPLRRWRDRILILLLAAPLAILSNAIRIGLLALIVGFDVPHQTALFDFFHEDGGSLFFSVLAVFLLCKLYLTLIDRQLAPASRASDAGS